MQPAVRTNLPVRVKNSYNPSAEGTLITADWTQKGLVSAITSKSNIAVIDITSTRMFAQQCQSAPDSQQALRPLAAKAHLLTPGYPLGPRREPLPRGCRSAAVVTLR